MSLELGQINTTIESMHIETFFNNHYDRFLHQQFFFTSIGKFPSVTTSDLALFRGKKSHFHFFFIIIIIRVLECASKHQLLPPVRK
jgi:hypothetical protein